MMPNNDASKKVVGYLCVLISVFGGVAVSAQSIVLSRQIDVQTIIFFRMGIGALFACFLMRTLGIAWKRDPHYRLISRSMLSATASQAIYFSMTKLPIEVSTCLFHSAPVWTSLFGWFFMGMNVNFVSRAAIFLCVTGVLLTSTPTSVGDPVGIWVGLIGAMLMSCLALQTSRLRNFSSFQIIIHSSLVATALSALLLVAKGQVVSSVSLLLTRLDLVMLLLFTAILGAFVQLIVVYAMQVLEPTIASTLKLLEIPLSLCLGVVIFGSNLGIMAISGAGLIMIGSSLLAIYSVPLVPIRSVRRLSSAGNTHHEQSVIIER